MNRTESTKEQMNQSSDRLLKVIECMAASRLPNRLTELAEKLDMPQPTLLRYLRSLCTQGYAYHDDQTGCYALTWKICRLSDSVKVNLALRSMASPYLNSLANTLNVGACLVVAHGDGTMYLDFVDNPHMAMSTMIRIGKNAPIHTTGSGKVLLGSFTDRKVSDIIERTGLERLTPHTITDKHALLAELDTVRKRGYAIDDEECEEGHKCVSAPLYDYSGGVAAAISIFDMAERLPDERIESEVLPLLFETAKEISYRLGHAIE